MNRASSGAGSRPPRHTRAPEFPVTPARGPPRRAWIRWSARRRPGSPVDPSAFQPSANGPRKRRPDWPPAPAPTVRPGPPDAVRRPARRPAVRRTPVGAAAGRQRPRPAAADRARAAGPWSGRRDRAEPGRPAGPQVVTARASASPSGRARAYRPCSLCARITGAPPRRTALSRSARGNPAGHRIGPGPERSRCVSTPRQSAQTATPGGHNPRTPRPARDPRTRPEPTRRSARVDGVMRCLAARRRHPAEVLALPVQLPLRPGRPAACRRSGWRRPGRSNSLLAPGTGGAGSRRR